MKKQPKSRLYGLLGSNLSQKEAELSTLHKTINDGTKRTRDERKTLVASQKEQRASFRKDVRRQKSRLLDEIIPYLDRKEGESTEDLKQRLTSNNRHGMLSNSKLLKLHRIVTRLKADFGGKKENLINALMKTRTAAEGKEDSTYRKHLEKKSIATLFLQYDHAKKSGLL